MGSEFLDYFGHIVNYMIFIYIFIRTIDTSCFSISDMSISLFGLTVSLFIFIVNLFNKRAGARGR